MLDMHHYQQMTDIIHGCIPYTGIEREIIAMPIFNRLHRISQSSLVYLTFASNNVKRFEHSIGTMHIAGEMFFNSVCNSDAEVLNNFFSEINDEIVKWRKTVNERDISFISRDDQMEYREDEVLKVPVPANPLYNMYHPYNLPADSNLAFYVAFQSVRLAAMLHDVGHLPYSHILENALIKMYSRTKLIEVPNENQKRYIALLGEYLDDKDKLDLHEAIGCGLVNKIESTIIEELVHTTDSERFFFALVFEFAKRILSSTSREESIYYDLHRIISSTVDADRLDYCSRDSFCAGTRKDIFCYERLFKNYKMAQVKYDILFPPPIIEKRPRKVPSHRDQFFFCPAGKSFGEIRELVQRRWRIYSDINFHHRVHKHESLLEEVVAELGVRELMKDNIPIKFSSDDMPFYIYSIWRLLERLSSNLPLDYLVIQLDDSWMDTLLKNYFFRSYGENYQSVSKHCDDLLWNRMDEIISTKKHYYSLFKRNSDFKEFDEAFYNKLKEKVKNNGISKVPGKKVDIFTRKKYTEIYHGLGQFAFAYLGALYSKQFDAFKYEYELENAINSYYAAHPEYNVADCLVRSCNFNMGLDSSTNPLLLQLPNGEVKPLQQLCPKFGEEFKMERNHSPSFHLYYLPRYDKENSTYFVCDISSIIDTIADNAADFFFCAIQKGLEATKKE
jgi:HD superfamily phosphohydrolase